MDATYKNLLRVGTHANVGYSVIGEFVVRSETAEEITEALRILASWNPEWHSLMMDYSEAEIGAISALFPTHLCEYIFIMHT